jgi:hypothetical protein
MKCKTHKRYTGKRSKPNLTPHQCLSCWLVYLSQHKVNMNSHLTVEDACALMDALAHQELVGLLFTDLEIA